MCTAGWGHHPRGHILIAGSCSAIVDIVPWNKIEYLNEGENLQAVAVGLILRCEWIELSGHKAPRSTLVQQSKCMFSDATDL